MEISELESGTKAVVDSPKTEPTSSYQPLRASVTHALQHYFSQLDGLPASNLYELVIAEVEAPLLEVVMQQVRNNQSKAAIMLGISRGTLRKLLKKYNLE